MRAACGGVASRLKKQTPVDVRATISTVGTGRHNGQDGSRGDAQGAVEQGLKLTRPVRIGASQLNPSVGPTVA